MKNVVSQIISLLMTACLLITANLFVFGQTRSYKTENSQQSNPVSKKDFLEKLGVNSSDRAKELLEKDAFLKVKKDSITAKTMQDADKTQQKKKFLGMNTTTAVIVGAALAAVIIIVLATKDKKEGEIPPNICEFPPYCNSF